MIEVSANNDGDHLKHYVSERTNALIFFASSSRTFTGSDYHGILLDSIRTRLRLPIQLQLPILHLLHTIYPLASIDHLVVPSISIA